MITVITCRKSHGPVNSTFIQLGPVQLLTYLTID